MSLSPRVFSKALQAASSSESPETPGECSEKGVSFQGWFKEPGRQTGHEMHLDM